MEVYRAYPERIRIHRTTDSGRSDMESCIYVRADIHQGAVDLIRSLPAVTLLQIVDEQRGTEAAQATAAAELDRRGGR